MEKGYVLDEYRDLVQGIRQVLPVTFNVKLSSYYRSVELNFHQIRIALPGRST